MSVRFAALDVAEGAAVAVLLLVDSVGGRYAPLADQARRAATSAALNLAEGAGRRVRDRTHHFRIAYGSAREAKSAPRMLTDVGQCQPEPAEAALRQLDRVCAMTWRLAKMSRAAAYSRAAGRLSRRPAAAKSTPTKKSPLHDMLVRLHPRPLRRLLVDEVKRAWCAKEMKSLQRFSMGAPR